jgi:chromosome partitioning protein
MITICLAEEKGGVGKTTVALNLAAGFAERGLRVLVLDTDGQANLTIGFGLKKSGAFYNLIVRSDPDGEYTEWNDVLRVLPPEVYRRTKDDPGCLCVVPGNVETMNIVASTFDLHATYRRMREVEPYFDVALFDTSPTPSMLHGTLFLASDYVLYPTELDFYSISGLKSTMKNIERFSAMRPVQTGGEKGAIQNLGIIPTRTDESTDEHSQNLATLRNDYGDLVLPSLALRTAWREASGARTTIFRYADKKPSARKAADEMTRITDVLMERMGYVKA